MRRLWIPVMLLAGMVLLAGCGGEPVVVPTVASLPTVTPSDTPSVTPPPTDEPFFTATPAGEAPPQGEGPSGKTPTGGEATAAPTEESPALPTPTPETMSEAPTAAAADPCAPAGLDALVAGMDLAALRADFDEQIAALRLAAANVGEWALDQQPDPFAGGTDDSPPLASLRYRRGDTQEAYLVVSAAPEPTHDFLLTCLGNEAFFREGDISEAATVTVEPLGIGDRGVVATVIEPVNPEENSSGLSELRTEIFTVLIGDLLIQYVNIPAMEEAMGMTPVTRTDALLLLSTVVNAARGG